MSLYQIDLNKMCRSIESNNSLEAIEYIDEHIRTVEWKMKAEEFESRKDEIEKSLGDVYELINSKMPSVINDVVTKGVDKVQKKAKKEGLEVDLETVTNDIKNCFVITEKSKFVKDMMEYITSSDQKNAETKGSVFMYIDSEKMSKIFGTRLETGRKTLLISFLITAIGSVLISTATTVIGGAALGLKLAKSSAYISSLFAGFGASTSVGMRNSGYGKAEAGSMKSGKQSLKELNLNKLFGFKQAFIGNNKIGYLHKENIKASMDYAKGKGVLKFLVYPKFTIKPVKSPKNTETSEN